MKVRVQFFSRLKDIAGESAEEVDLPEGAGVGELLEKLYQRHEALRAWDAHLLVAVELEYVPRDHALREGDEVSVMPPVQGG